MVMANPAFPASARALPRSIVGLLVVVTILSSIALMVWDVSPRLFPEHAHDILGALPPAFIAITFLAHEAVRRAARPELAKALLVAVAFLFWGANAYWPDIPATTLLNDVAVVLFVLDLLITMRQSSPAPRPPIEP
jgi:hypothetical protein